MTLHHKCDDVVSQDIKVSRLLPEPYLSQCNIELDGVCCDSSPSSEGSLCKSFMSTVEVMPFEEAEGVIPTGHIPWLTEADMVNLESSHFSAKMYSLNKIL